MHMQESTFPEKPVDGKGQRAAHAKHSAKGIGPWAQMRDGSQKLKAVAFFLQRVGTIGIAEDFSPAGRAAPMPDR